MADEEREFRIRITGDAGGIVKASKEGESALKGVAGAGNEAVPALDKVGQKTEEAGKASEHAGISHRALHLIFSQVGEASKGLEIGLMAVTGVMMGSVTFGIYAVVAAVKALVAHFERQKEVALEAAKATVQFWTDALQGNADARKAAADYADAMQKIITNVDTLKQKESEEEAVLKRAVELRLKILDAQRQAEIAAAKGNKDEEARINARYGQRKPDIELQNEQAEIDLKKRHLAEQTEDALRKEQASASAEKAKETGAPGREDASAAEARLPKLKEELATLQAARMKPEDLAALKAKVAADVEQFKNGGLGAFGEAALGNAQARAEQLAKANRAEQDYGAAQQEYEQSQADIERFKTGTAALAKAVEDALREVNKAVELARTTGAEIRKDEATHGVNVDAANTIQGVKDKSEIEGAGGKYNRASANVLGEVRAMAGAGEGERMSAQDTAYFNNLLAAARAQGKEAMVRAVIKELQDIHVDESKKWQDLWAAIKDIRKQHRDTFNQ